MGTLHAAFLLPLLLPLAAAATADHLCCGVPTRDGGLSVVHRRCPDNSEVPLNCSYVYYMDHQDEPEPFSVNDAGRLYLQHSGMVVSEPGRFCVSDYFPNGTAEGAVVCFEEQLSASAESSNPLTVFYAYGGLLYVTVAFLAATLVVYLSVPQLRDRDGLCLCAYIGSLMLGSFSLATINFATPHIGLGVCNAFAFFTYFWMLSAFFWLNIVVFNVWQCVSSRRVSGKGPALLLGHLAYGWGVPLIFLCAALITHHAPSHLQLLAPGFGETRCWFSGQLQTWAYFFGPVAVLLALNTALFLWAAVLLWRSKPSETATRPFKTMRFRCRLYIKLSLVMGVTWLFEVISFASGSKGYFWLAADVVNCLQGLLIFLLLVVGRRRVRRLLVARWPTLAVCCCTRGQLLPSPLSQTDIDPQTSDEEDFDVDDAQELNGVVGPPR